MIRRSRRSSRRRRRRRRRRGDFESDSSVWMTEMMDDVVWVNLLFCLWYQQGPVQDQQNTLKG